MIPWETLDRARAPGGEELVLCRRGKEWTIRVGGTDLMGSRMHGSEDALAMKGCAPVAKKRGARVLIGGLGMGFTLRAALDALGADARVDVVELVPAVVRWNREWFGDLAKHPLRDPRVHVIEDDVVAVIDEARDAYDAILLDVDNGPDALTAKGNRKLYDVPGITRAASALRTGGQLCVWSAKEDAKFTARLGRAGLRAEVVRVRAHGSSGTRHVIWIATKK